jgi:hypothetical protein
MLISSSEVVLYCIASGCISLFAYNLAKAMRIDVSGLSFNEHPVVLAVIVGITGQDLILSLFPTQNENSRFLNGFMSFIYAIRDWPFYRYSIKRNLRLLPQVATIMPNVPYEQLHELISSCIGITRGISDEDSSLLIDRIKEIDSTYNSDPQKKNDIGLEIAKVIGINLLKQVAEQLQQDSQLDVSIEELNRAMAKIS